MLQQTNDKSNRPAQWLAEATAKKFPHLADVARRGAEVVASGRVNLAHDHAANVRATITNPRATPYTIERITVTDLERWDYDPQTKRTINREKTIYTCNCPSCRREQYRFNGEAYCKHLWAVEAQRTIDALCNAFAFIVEGMKRCARPISPEYDPADYWGHTDEPTAKTTPPRIADPMPTVRGYREMTQAERDAWHMARVLQEKRERMNRYGVNAAMADTARHAAANQSGPRI